MCPAVKQEQRPVLPGRVRISRDPVLPRRQALLPTGAVGTTKWSLESVSGLLGTRRCCGAVSRGSSATDDFAVEEWSKQIANRTTISRETGYCPRWPATADRQNAAGKPPGPLPSAATLSRSRKRARLPAASSQIRQAKSRCGLSLVRKRLSKHLCCTVMLLRSRTLCCTAPSDG